MKKTIVAAVILILVCVLPLLAASPVIDIELLRQEARTLLVKAGMRWLEIDSNNDGKIDHSMLLSRNGDKVYEEIDMNHDDLMDDLCYYKNGVIIREETDTNYDGKIDLWVFIREGVYVERYAQDKDFDGVIDITKEYGPGKR
ncbi:MAG: hypothetical protein LBT68_08415 [Spirochaetales bacterium]|jgi:hypothetical protein|nr:hypothetical protein [Spirochaetales bacterium]